MMDIKKKIYMIVGSCAMLFAYQASGQDQVWAVDRSDVYIGEAVDRDSIDASEIPLEVMKSFEKSEFSDMQIERVHRIEAQPTSDSVEAYSTPEEDSLIEGEVMEDTEMLDSEYTDRPVDMREENDTEREKYDIAQTYYQDTYEDATVQKDEMEGEEQTEVDEAERGFIQDKAVNDTTTYGQSSDPQGISEGETNTYYELEVSGENMNYVLLFDEEGNLRHSEAQKM